MNLSQYLNALATYCRGDESSEIFTRTVFENAMNIASEEVLPSDLSQYGMFFNGRRNITKPTARKILKNANKERFADYLCDNINYDSIEDAKVQFGLDVTATDDELYNELLEMFFIQLQLAAFPERKKSPVQGDADEVIPVVTVSRPVQPTGFFRGRGKQLAIIKETLTGVSKLMLINGMGGIGKTEICRKLFREAINGLLPEVCKVGWLTYSGSLAQTCLHQFPAIKKPSAKQVDYMLQAEKYINAQGGDLLLFVDNANEMTARETAQLLKLNCKIILTSRRRNVERLTIPSYVQLTTQ